MLCTLLILSLCAVVFGWSEQEREIFRVRDELELNEGEGVSFYDFIGVKNGPSASLDEINKAYKKTSLRLHPDKNRPKKTLSKAAQAAERKKAAARFARLGLVANILRGPSRDSYDHFLKNGFPKWRGTGYYYARYRPGLGSVFIGLYLFAGVVHYIIQILNARQQREYMERIIKEARALAWGSAGVPGLAQALGETTQADATQAALSRKDRRSKKGTDSASGTATPVSGGARRKVTAENGKQFVVDSMGNVFLLHDGEDGVEEYPLDLNEIQGAAWGNTLWFTLPKWFFRITIGRFLGGAQNGDDIVEEDYEDEEVEEPAAGTGSGEPTKKKKGVAKKVERSADGAPRRRVKGRPAKK